MKNKQADSKDDNSMYFDVGGASETLSLTLLTILSNLFPVSLSRFEDFPEKWEIFEGNDTRRVEGVRAGEDEDLKERRDGEELAEMAAIEETRSKVFRD